MVDNTLEELLEVRPDELWQKSVTTHLLYQSELEKRQIIGQGPRFGIAPMSLAVLFYIRGLDKTPGVNINALPMWSDLSERFKSGTDRLLEYEVIQQQTSIANVAIEVKKFYTEPNYRSQMLSLYKEKFRPFCEYVNAQTSAKASQSPPELQNKTP